MLLQRVITALVLAPLVILLILLANTPVFAAVVGIAFLLAMWEWTRLARVANVAARIGMLVLLAALMGAAWWTQNPNLWACVAVLGVVWWIVACQWLRHFAYAAAPTPENSRLKLLAGIFVIVPAWAALVLIHGSQPYGNWWTFLALVLVWVADIGAYFAGRQFGKRKLAPQISPGKTWAGAYGALASAAVVAAIGGWLLKVHGVQLIGLVILAMFTTVASIVGDLLESLMKRHAQVKDSGALFPGHGGLLDRMDSVFAALPVFAIGKLLLGL